jgi:hypothetical protein
MPKKMLQAAVFMGGNMRRTGVPVKARDETGQSRHRRQESASFHRHLN